MNDQNRSTTSYQNSSGRPTDTVVIGLPCPCPSNMVTSSGTPSNPNGAQPQPPPPPSINIPTAHTQTPTQPQGSFGFVCMLFLFLSAFIAAIICIAVLIPNGDSKNPTIEVESMVVSPFNVSGTKSDPRISALWDIGFLVRNPNKRVKINYRQIDVSLYYKTALLMKETIKPFGQLAKNQTSLKVGSGLLEKQLDDEGVWLSLAEDLREGSVEFQIYLVGEIHFNGYGDSWMRGSCPHVRVGISSNATSTAAATLSGSSTCKIRIS